MAIKKKKKKKLILFFKNKKKSLIQEIIEYNQNSFIYLKSLNIFFIYTGEYLPKNIFSCTNIENSQLIFEIYLVKKIERISLIQIE